MTQPSVGAYGQRWTQFEVDEVTDAYFRMLADQRAGRRPDKREYVQRLRSVLINRTDASIIRKFGNISAVLIEGGHEHVAGCSPQAHYQRILRDAVASRLTP